MLDKLAVARRALAQAEQHVGLRIALPQEHTAPLDESLAYRMPDYLHSLFPQGLPKGAPLVVTGAKAALFLLAGIASQQGAWVAFVGLQNVGWSMVEKSGVNTKRFAYIPVVNAQAAQVAQAAADAFDLVVLDLRLTLREQRVLDRRARMKNTTLITRDWVGATRVDCHALGVSGVQKGHVNRADYLLSGPDGHVRLSYGENGWGPAVSSTLRVGAVTTPKLRVVSAL